MAQYTTESIYHFIGYLHLGDLLNRADFHYEGGPGWYHPEIISMSGQGRSGGLDIEMPGPSRPGAEVDFGAKDEASPAFFAPRVFIKTSHDTLRGPEYADLPDYRDTIAAPVGYHVSTIINFRYEPLTIKLTYDLGPSQYTHIAINQLNNLLDDDLLLATDGELDQLTTSLQGAHAAEAAETLLDMIAQAEALIPEGLLELGQDAAGIEHVHIQQIDGGQDLFIDEGSGPGEPDSVSEGQYVNGVLQEGEPDSIDDQVADMIAYLDAIAEDEDRDFSQTVHTTDGSKAATELTEPVPTAGFAQHSVAGGNDSINVAILNDLSDAAGSLTVRGDYYKTDIIVQINILHDNDKITISDDALVNAFVPQANSVANEATFSSSAGTVYGDVTQGYFPGNTSWHVDFITGDFYDIKAIHQKNIVGDNDAAAQSGTSTHFFTSLGENDQINIAQLAELSTQYDLIIVGGNYYQYNMIVQVNLVLDDDYIQMIGGDDDDDHQAFVSGDNHLMNDAAIISNGNGSFKALEGAPAQLAEYISQQAGEVDYALAIGLPGNGNDTFEVLYIDGDYFDYNLITQTNIIADVDDLTQIADRNSGHGSGKDHDVFSQTAEGGGNTATNAALIVDAGSTSDYQYLGGEYYDEQVLVQAEIITNDDDISVYSDGLHEDVVATLAALADAEEMSSSRGHSDDDDGPGSSASDGDVVGSMMT